MDSNGLKGMLLEKAGIQEDTSEFTNIMYDQIKAYTKSIDRLTNILTDKEDSYYKKFSALETAINRMNSQSSWLSSQM
jgi:flagellar hook-associated protein 2